MSSIECVIVACSKSAYHRQLTEKAIATSGVPCIVVETHPGAQDFQTAKKTIHWHRPFNYNACLNEGILHTESEYIALCNNDLLFHRNWTQITTIMDSYGAMSASPFSMYRQVRDRYREGNYIHEGYSIGHEICGWCIVVHRDLIRAIGKLREDYEFWCSDNVYAEQIQALGFKHILVCSCRVDHVGGGSRTLNTVQRYIYYKYTVEAFKKYYAQRKAAHKNDSEDIP